MTYPQMRQIINDHYLPQIHEATGKVEKIEWDWEYAYWVAQKALLLKTWMNALTVAQRRREGCGS